MPSNKKQLESALRKFRRLADAAYQDDAVMEKWELAWWLHENTVKGRKRSKYEISIADLGPISPYGKHALHQMRIVGEEFSREEVETLKKPYSVWTAFKLLYGRRQSLPGEQAA
jgi:hypothetical protein